FGKWLQRHAFHGGTDDGRLGRGRIAGVLFRAGHEGGKHERPRGPSYTIHGRDPGVVRMAVASRSCARLAAFRAAATSFPCVVSASRALRCASSTLASADAPSRYASNDMAATRLAAVTCAPLRAARATADA